VLDFQSEFWWASRESNTAPTDYESNQAGASLPAITGIYKRFDHSKSPEITPNYSGIPAEFRQKNAIMMNTKAPIHINQRGKFSTFCKIQRYGNI